MPSGVPRLILNADDFAYTTGVNQAIVELSRQGALTSTTLMATGAALKDAIARLAPPAASSIPDLRKSSPLSFAGSSQPGIGCHVVLVDGHSVLPHAELPTLTTDELASLPSSGRTSSPGDRSVEHRSRFRPTLGGFVADLLRGRIRESEIEREAIAQIRLLQALVGGSGRKLTHLDTHKHTHIFPRVLRPLLRAALACGIPAVRNPFEPAWSLRATSSASLLRRAEVRLLGSFRPEFTRLVRQAGLKTTDGAIGVLVTGSLDLPALTRLLRVAKAEAAHSPRDSVWELVCHPGYHDQALDAEHTRLKATREIERAALASIVPELASFELITFRDLAG